MPRRRGCRGRARGLTLIELMVGVAVLALLASLAVPATGHQLARWKLQAAAEQLAADLAQARWDAVERGRAQHLQLQDGEQWCWSLSEAPGCGCDRPQACQRQRVAAARYGGVTLETPARISFAPTADARIAVASLALSSRSGERLRVLLSPLGRARVCAPDGPRMGYAAC